MRPDRSVGLWLVSVFLGATTAGAADPASVLKEKGLAKSGTTYVIEDEKPVLEKMKEVKAAFAGYSQAAERQAEQEQAANNLVLLGQQQAELQQQLNAMNRQISSQPRVGGRAGRMASSSQANPMVAERAQVQAALNEVSAGQKALKSQAPQAKDKAAAAAEVKKRGDAFKAALEELRPMVDDVTAKYAVLEADEAVKKARTALQEATHANIKLGPSEAFKSAVKSLEHAERQFLGKKPPAASKAKAKAKK